VLRLHCAHRHVLQEDGCPNSERVQDSVAVGTATSLSKPYCNLFVHSLNTAPSIVAQQLQTICFDKWKPLMLTISPHLEAAHIATQVDIFRTTPRGYWFV
jgi:hypothetical protein